MKSSEVYKVAVRLLARRDHTRAELSQKLRQRGFPEDLAAEACEALIERGFLDDRRVAENLLRAALDKRDVGSRRLAQQLGKRLLPRAIVEEVMADFLSQADELARATAMVLHHVDSGLERAAIERKLWQRGVPAGVVRAALSAVNLDKNDEEG